MAIEKTVFESDVLKEVLETYYPFHVLSTAPAGFASANIYRIVTDAGVFCLKEFPKKITEEMLMREVYICRHLLQKGFSVPAHVRTQNGVSYFSYQGHFCALYHWLDGDGMDANTGTFEQLAESAELYANLLCAMEDLSITLPTPDCFDHSADAIDRSILEHKLLLLLAPCEEVKLELTQKIQMLERLKTFDWSGAEDITWKNSHGDYNPFQFLCQNGRITAVLDFMSARKMPVVFELFRNFLYMDPQAGSRTLSHDRLSAYLQTFQRHHALSDADLTFMIPLYYLRILKSTFGYREYCHDTTKPEYRRLGKDLFEQCLWLEKQIR